MTTKRSRRSRPAAARTSDIDVAAHVGTVELPTEMAEGATVSTLPDGRIAFLPPNAVKTLSVQTRNYLADLQELVVFRARLLDQVGEMVAQLRSEGVSWGLIGWYVGTTAEAARQRWGGQGGNNA